MTTAEERKIIDLLRQARTLFEHLEPQYAADLWEWDFHLNGAERVLATRVAQRLEPQVWFLPEDKT